MFGDWAVIASDWVDDWSGDAKTPEGLNLEAVIAHELDHILGSVEPGLTDHEGHLIEDGAVNLAHTLNSKRCAGENH